MPDIDVLAVPSENPWLLPQTTLRRLCLSARISSGIRDMSPCRRRFEKVPVRIQGHANETKCEDCLAQNVGGRDELEIFFVIASTSAFAIGLSLIFFILTSGLALLAQHVCYCRSILFPPVLITSPSNPFSDARNISDPYHHTTRPKSTATVPHSQILDHTPESLHVLLFPPFLLFRWERRGRSCCRRGGSRVGRRLCMCSRARGGPGCGSGGLRRPEGVGVGC